jgi:hypothetical protein
MAILHSFKYFCLNQYLEQLFIGIISLLALLHYCI